MFRGLATAVGKLFSRDKSASAAELEAADREIALPSGVTPVVLSPRALEMLQATKANAEAVREHNKPVVKGPLRGSREWRIQEAKRAKGLLQ